MRWFLLCLLFGCRPGGVPPEPAASPDVAFQSTVLLESGEKHCGAVAVGPRTLATAAHCLSGPHVLYATSADPDDWRSGVVTWQDDRGDVATVATSEPLPVWASVASVSLGADVYSINHGGGHSWSIGSGYVFARPTWRGLAWLQTTIPIVPGASGCGLWDDHDRLIGIAHGFDARSSFFASIELVHQ